jgi:hypothetical protein
MTMLEDALETVYYLVKHPCGYIEKGKGETPYLYTTEGRARAVINRIIAHDYYTSPSKEKKYQIIPVKISKT